jgi:hypothetical protein
MQERARRVWDAINGLPPTERRALIEVVIEGASLRGAGKKAGCQRHDHATEAETGLSPVATGACRSRTLRCDPAGFDPSRVVIAAVTAAS